MAKFSTKAADALKKVLKRRTLVDMSIFIDSLKRALENEVGRSKQIEAEAERILHIEYYADGTEIIDKGPLERNLTQDLDEDGLRRAISIVESAHTELKAEREAWLMEQKKNYKSEGPALKWQESWYSHHGPGVALPPPGKKTSA